VQKVNAVELEGSTKDDSPIKEIRRIVTDPSVCDFYHAVELPDGSVPAAEWDLRATAHEYLGGVGFSGKRFQKSRLAQ
jgi:hypothetical protein